MRPSATSPSQGASTAPSDPQKLRGQSPRSNRACSNRPLAALRREPRAGRRVLHEPAEPRDLVADLVPSLEIAPRPRLAARGQELLDLERRAVHRGSAAEEPEHAREPHQLVDAGDEGPGGA